LYDATSLMRVAIQEAREGIRKGQSPFGCAISVNGRLLAAAHNCVFALGDITAHAEITAIREACAKTGKIALSGSIVACTCEPCPMCMAALHWARVETVYCGATIADAQSAGFNELTLPAAKLLELGASQVKLVPGILLAECRQLLEEWKRSSASRPY
jgi:tRNA(Arg) A34 adenosine deaminase TadA